MNENISENRTINRRYNFCAGCLPVSDDFHSEPIQRKAKGGIADTEPHMIWAGISSQTQGRNREQLAGVIEQKLVSVVILWFSQKVQRNA